MTVGHRIEVKRETHAGGTVAYVTYDYARCLNVLNPGSLIELAGTFHALAAEHDLRAVVFAGAGGRAFIGGADIHHMATMRHPDEGRAFITLVHKLCQSIRDCPVPVICRLEGYTLGAGLEVAAACDIRIAADSAHFGMPEVKVGSPSVVEAAQLGDAIGRCVQSIVAGTPKAVRGQKRLMRRWERLPLDEAVQAGIDAFAQSVGEGEHIERMAAFVNRKKKG